MDTGDNLREAITEVLARFPLMIGERVAPEDAQRVAVNPRLASMTIDAPAAHLAIRLAAPLALCRQFATNILGITETDAAPDVAEDALKEFLNIVCGTFVVAQCGNRMPAALGIPAVRRLGRSEWAALWRDSQALCFDVEGQPLVAAVTIPAVE